MVTDYLARYPPAGTRVSLDTGSLGVLGQPAKKWSVSKAEVMRLAIRKAKEEASLFN